MRSAEIRKEIILDEFIIMPNHIHGIIIINNDVGTTEPVARKNDANADVGATRWVAQDYGANDCGAHVDERATQRVAPTGPLSRSIGAIIGQFKTAVTKRINQIRDNPGVPVWQRNYFERVIRNDRELAAIREYIVYNPVKWAMDRENPAN